MSDPMSAPISDMTLIVRTLGNKLVSEVFLYISFRPNREFAMFLSKTSTSGLDVYTTLWQINSVDRLTLASAIELLNDPLSQGQWRIISATQNTVHPEDDYQNTPSLLYPLVGLLLFFPLGATACILYQNALDAYANDQIKKEWRS